MLRPHPNQAAPRGTRWLYVASFAFCTAAFVTGLSFLFALHLGLEALALYHPHLRQVKSPLNAIKMRMMGMHACDGVHRWLTRAAPCCTGAVHARRYGTAGDQAGAWHSGHISTSEFKLCLD
jgi:hypothetical protein